MKVKCYDCGFTYERKVLWEGMCPKCGCFRWVMSLEDSEKLFHENPYLPKDYTKRIMKKEEGLAFEIFQIENGNKIKNRKIYLNGHIEGFKGNPCVINHIAPKIMVLKCLLQQMNKDYRDFIEKHLLMDLPIDPLNLSKLYQAELERIENIKI